MPSSSFGNTFGSLLLGACFGLMMFGMAIHQTYRYFFLYKSDGRILKATVLTVFLSNLLHSALCIHTCYYYLVQGEAIPSYLNDGVWSLRLIGPMSLLIVLLVQGFYFRRIYTIGMPAYILVSVACLMLGAAASALFMAVNSFIIPSFAEWAHYTWLSAVPFGFILATDAILTGSLIYWLHRSRTGFQDTDSLLNVLIVYTINTGLLTSTLGLLCLVFALARPMDFAYIALNMPTTNCYTNSMFAVYVSSLFASARRQRFASPPAACQVPRNAVRVPLTRLRSLNSRRALAKRGNKTRELGTFGFNVDSSQARGTAHSRALPPVSLSQRQSALARSDVDTIPGHIEWRISVAAKTDSDARTSISSNEMRPPSRTSELDAGIPAIMSPAPVPEEKDIV
ncbi:hypothetical protein C8Q73DRAFT_789887 [Cubamyces lactineus]|nr:hypothetical protein C8Q73DRAFT_789887 [Cubamyces lactineus]